MIKTMTRSVVADAKGYRMHDITILDEDDCTLGRIHFGAAGVYVYVGTDMRGYAMYLDGSKPCGAWVENATEFPASAIVQGF